MLPETPAPGVRAPGRTRGHRSEIAEHHNDYQGAGAFICGALDLARFARVYEPFSWIQGYNNARFVGRLYGLSDHL